MGWFVKNGDLINFLNDLATDSDLLEEYKKDPKAVMDKAGLSDEDKAVLLTDDKEKLIEAFTDRLSKV